MAQPLRILTIDTDEKTLRTPSEHISMEELKSPEFQDFIQSLYLTLETSGEQVGWEAAGIAAVQVGNLKKLFWAMNPRTAEFNEYINAEIEYLGDAQDVQDEGCLSLPDDIGPVRRHKRIRVTYLDRHGNQHRDKLSGYHARIVQHEYDHTEGVLFTDKLANGSTN